MARPSKNDDRKLMKKKYGESSNSIVVEKENVQNLRAAPPLFLKKDKRTSAPAISDESPESKNVLRKSDYQMQRSYSIKELSLYSTCLGSPTRYQWHDGQDIASKPRLLDFKLFQKGDFIAGGHGSIFAVQDSTIPSPQSSADSYKENLYILKVKERKSENEGDWHAAKREYRIMMKVSHPFIVKLIHTYESTNHIAMILEYIQGDCLRSIVLKKGLLSDKRTAYVAACVLVALEYLHKLRIVYRDMKTDNVVFDLDSRPKLIDFSMAKPLKLTNDGSGNVYDDNATRYHYAGYLAPEIYTNSATVNTKCDIWGLGYLVYSMNLGYGVTKSLHWSKREKEHLKRNWILTFDKKDRISDYCKTFLFSTMTRWPEDRVSLAELKFCQMFSYYDINFETLISTNPKRYNQ